MNMCQYLSFKMVYKLQNKLIECRTLHSENFSRCLLHDETHLPPCGLSVPTVVHCTITVMHTTQPYRGRGADIQEPGYLVNVYHFFERPTTSDKKKLAEKFVDLIVT